MKRKEREKRFEEMSVQLKAAKKLLTTFKTSEDMAANLLGRLVVSWEGNTWPLIGWLQEAKHVLAVRSDEGNSTKS